jgi:hypothetical protein
MGFMGDFLCGVSRPPVCQEGEHKPYHQDFPVNTDIHSKSDNCSPGGAGLPPERASFVRAVASLVFTSV